jgi:hypothetical protein
MPGAFQYKMNELENEMIAAAGAYSWKDHALCGYIHIQSGKVYQENSSE